MHRSEIAALFVRHNIPISQYGIGIAKTLSQLATEIKRGECWFDTNEAGELLRRGNVAAVIVETITPDGTRLRLREDRQVLTNGETRIRTAFLTWSIGEKMMHDEPAVTAARRALVEELGITEVIPLESSGVEERGSTISPSYPGLINFYTIHHFHVTLPAHLYKTEGYVEKQPDKTTYFVWEPVS